MYSNYLQDAIRKDPVFNVVLVGESRKCDVLSQSFDWSLAWVGTRLHEYLVGDGIQWDADGGRRAGEQAGVQGGAELGQHLVLSDQHLLSDGGRSDHRNYHQPRGYLFNSPVPAQPGYIGRYQNVFTMNIILLEQRWWRWWRQLECSSSSSRWFVKRITHYITQTPLMCFVSSCAANTRVFNAHMSYRMCKVPLKLSPPTNQHPTFYRPDSLPVTQPTISEHWREKISHSIDCSSQTHLGYSMLVLITKGSWLPRRRVVKPLVSPLTPVPTELLLASVSKNCRLFSRL